MIVDNVPHKKRLRTFVFFMAMLVLYLGLCELISFTVGNSNIILGILFYVIGIICFCLSIVIFTLFIRFIETFRSLSKSKIPYLVFIILSGIICGVLIVYSFQLYEAEKAQLKPVDPATTITGVDTNPNAPVTCDNKVMSPTEVCDHIFSINGSSTTTTYTYNEQRQYQKQQRIYADRSAKIQKMPVKQQSPLDNPFLRMLILAGVAFGMLVLVGTAMLRQRII